MPTTNKKHDIHNINDHTIVEVNVVSYCELESARCFAMELALVAILRDLLDDIAVYMIVVSLREDVVESVSRRVAKKTVKLS